MVSKYYHKHKERLQKETLERYQHFTEEEKDQKRKPNLSEYRRNYHLTHKK